MKKLITIGRQCGAGGAIIGQKVAEALGIEYFDKDLILRTAKASANLSPDEIHRWDEKVPKDFSFNQGLFNFYTRPLGDKIWDAQVKAIRKMANEHSCVIVGRNADYILREYDHCLRVFIHADLEWRVDHMMSLMPDTPEAQVRADIKSADKARQNYCTHFTGRAYGDATSFDLTLNTSKLGIDGAVEQILAAAKYI